MTEPQPYPGDLPADVPAPTGPTLPAGATGVLQARDAQDNLHAVVVEDGRILTALPPGTYKLVGALAGADGLVRYISETVTL